MKIITVANQKGGIGKTTTATCIASILRKKGYRTLLIDADAQCNSTDVYRAKIEDTYTLYDLLLEKERCSLADAVQHTEFGDIVASDALIAKADQMLMSECDAHFRLREALEQANEYDFIIVDTNPTINYMLFNALAASDDVLIPITADRFAVAGLAQLTNTIAAVRKYQNPRLNTAGLLLVKFHERSNINRDTRESLQSYAEKIGTKLFKTYIRESVKCRESQAMRMPLIEYAPDCTTQKDYEAFVEEYLKEV